MHFILPMVDPVIDLGSAATGAVTAILTQLDGVLPVALGVGGTVIAITVGWRLFRRFAK